MLSVAYPLRTPPSLMDDLHPMLMEMALIKLSGSQNKIKVMKLGNVVGMGMDERGEDMGKTAIRIHYTHA